MFKRFLLKKKMKQYGFQYIKVPKDIIDKYRNTTKKNAYISDREIEFKIIREYYSASVQSRNNIRDIVTYGFLRIIKDNKRNMIIDIHNSKSNRNGKIKYDIKDLLNSIYVSVYKEEI
jgi:hypothetical protein